MNTPTPAAKLPDMDVLMDIATRFETAKAEDAALKDAQVGSLLRHVDGKRAIMRGTFQGRAAVIRMYLDRPEWAARDWAELMRVWPYMNDGDARVSQPLYHLPAHGMVIVEEVRGTPLFQHMWRSDPGDRAQHLTPVAAWLKRYGAPTEEMAPARAGRWMKMARKAAARQPFNRLRKLQKPVLVEMARIAAAMDGMAWRQATIHGDYHPNNLILNGTRLTGIDLGGSAVMPVYKDIARFLMHIGRRGMIPSGQARFGVDAVGIGAFAEAFDLSAQERDLAVPFFIAVEALIRVENRAMKTGRVRQAREMYGALLEGLRGVRV